MTDTYVAPKPETKQISYADSRVEFSAADLAVQDAERALAAATYVRGVKANAAAEAGARESEGKQNDLKKKNADIAAKAHANACDAAHVRERDVVGIPATGASHNVNNDNVVVHRDVAAVPDEAKK
jgi:hypothetical protein